MGIDSDTIYHSTLRKHAGHEIKVEVYTREGFEWAVVCCQECEETLLYTRKVL